MSQDCRICLGQRDDEIHAGTSRASMGGFVTRSSILLGLAG
jgi:hypothetical protein